MVEILKVVDECCRDLSVVDIGESSLRASGEAEELRRWSDGARALGDAGGWLVVTLVPFAVWIDGESMGRRGVCSERFDFFVETKLTVTCWVKNFRIFS